MNPHSDTFEAMSDQTLWLEFTPDEGRAVRAFLDIWNLRPGQTVLEPGCGTGRLTRELAAAVEPDGRVLACDTAPGMIARAQGRRLPQTARFELAATSELDHPAACFDAVVCFNVLPHLVPVAGHLARFHRWLKPGGRLWIAHTAGRRTINAIHRQAGMNEHLLPDADTLRALLGDAGFEVDLAEDREDRYHIGARRPG